MTLYNLTGIAQNTTGVVQLMQGVNNELMFGYFGVVMLISLAIFFFTAFIYATNDTAKAMTATAFIVFILSILLRAMGLVSNLAMMFCLIAAGLTLAFTWKQ